jgi:hypothetical protein
MPNRRMIAAMAGAGALAASVMLAPSAGATAHHFPAQNDGACKAYFGEGNYTFTNVQGTKTCTGTASTEVITKEAGNSGRAWVVEVEEEGTYTSKGNVDTSDVTVDTTCTNPGGQVKEGEDLPTHCTLP